MKTLYIISLLFIYNLSSCQTIKSLSDFYTDKQPSELSEVTNLIYYKDTNNYFTPFLGTWTAQIDSNIFVVRFWKEAKKPIKSNGGILYYSDEIFGHYKLIQNFGTIRENTIYSSEINFLNSPTLIPTAIYATSNYTNKLGGTIYDINTMSNQKYWGTRGELEMIISGTTATWKISDSEKINPGAFIIPRNLILTKQ